MEQSLLYATHLALKNLLWKHSIWDIYAYVPGNKMTVPPKWKIKTKKYNHNTYKFSFDSLKYYDSKNDKWCPIMFDFGWREREKVTGIGIEVLQLQYEYSLEREIVEKICSLADSGHMIMANKEIILDKFKGSEFLISIDMEAPSYSSMDVSSSMPF